MSGPVGGRPTAESESSVYIRQERDTTAGVSTAAQAALTLRDRALAALDGGDPAAALGIAERGLALLGAAGAGGGADEAALLVAAAETEEALGRAGAAGMTAAAAAGLLGGIVAAAPGDDGSLVLWCQAQERLAGLERAVAGHGTPGRRSA